MKKNNTGDNSYNPLSKLPQINILLNSLELSPYCLTIGRANVSHHASESLKNIRKNFKNGTVIPNDREIKQEIVNSCKKTERSRIRKVINGTGIILHTNLGRSPLSDSALNNAFESLKSYAAVEIDINTGKRGERFPFLLKSISQLTNSEDSLIVNNNASSVFLMLTALAKGKEVIVSRGQQVQIGGGFRIPDILALSGCKLREVGTTNITTIDDIKEAINEETAMVLVVHTSNYKIRGFTKSPTLEEIKKIIPHNVILALDQGSGNMEDQIPDEPPIREMIKKGADIVCFSGDKILGGPQAGFIVGKREILSIIKKHPLMRTYRVGKVTAAIMEEVLISHLNGLGAVPTNTLKTPKKVVKAKGETILDNFPKGKITMIDYPLTLGGGTTPDQGFESFALVLHFNGSAEKIHSYLRDLHIPVLSIIHDDKVHLHLATLKENDFPYLINELKVCAEVFK